ncbi:LuxR C-terminal-related transcriptional regulator [Streptomyces sp. NPDC047461]|uniref:response regulator transcription factor n=1 Tax=Streptomyces sp. NPDC047461 TaxID=3155619 RepID=UPI0033FFD870
MVAYYLYGALLFVALPLWPVGLVVDGVWSGLLRREPVVLPLIAKVADLEADWSTALLKPSPKARLTRRVEELAATRADAIAAHGAELRRIERDLHDGAQADLEFLDALERVAGGGTALDPEVVTELLTRRKDTPLDSLTPRERETFALMAEGHDNATIAKTLVVTERAVHKHIGNVFLKLGLPPSDSGHRRVPAVLAYLAHTPQA